MQNPTPHAPGQAPALSWEELAQEADRAEAWSTLAAYQAHQARKDVDDMAKDPTSWPAHVLEEAEAQAAQAELAQDRAEAAVERMDDLRFKYRPATVAELLGKYAWLLRHYTGPGDIPDARPFHDFAADIDALRRRPEPPTAA
ncbi:hypothetical protein [Phenylobacterium sp.]|uniref:hypothetical protein n=1 Tax=Phenylobacterium sp. TaxID=1871053 RepID=UPI0025FF3170|nr:hypothetical protein [Phenylobacterium sp.]MCA6311147.1 hypothetical protein [Phenylobacterium sp.]MCA6324840.1 hypothetical protein [Phenylobacterium sp.]MCA6339560.1 hypothetical protein [Phenylobacterium sp.]MCA6346529.1 hypothetical protein [Phenylobacterium sp.]MCA6348510.1 hypothetical protein [Phenylobacterium sp.]